MRHSERIRLMCSDIDNALKSKNIEPLYGFECSEYIPLRYSSGGGKEIYYPEDQEVDLVNIISSPLPRLPCEVTMHAHWLSVEGVQPSVPENVPPLSLEQQRQQAVALSLKEPDPTLTSKDIRLERKRKKESESSEWVKLKPLQPHLLTQEQQFYYKELTDTCIGLSDTKRQEALASISTDPSLCQLLPQLVTFVMEGIKVNIAQRKLTSLKNLLRIINALLENATVSIERFLHELIPSTCTCLLNRQICSRPESEDHWSLRDLAAKIVALICKKYSNSVNNIQTRLTRTFSQTLQGNIQQGLAPHYGAVAAFGELGQEVITACVIPRIKQEGELIKMAQIGLAGPSKIIEQVAANKLQGSLQRYCSPYLQQSRPATDTLLMYQQDYGYLGTCLFNHVKSLRQGRPTLTLSNVHKFASGTPTSPKAKLSPLTLTSPHVTATKITTSKGGTISLGSPGLRLQINSPTTGTSIATIPVSLLSAVVNSPTVAQALANQLSGVSTSAALSSVVSTLQEQLNSSTSKTSTLTAATTPTTSSN